MQIGYARVSTDGQSLEPQLDALKKAGCERTFADKASGAKTGRPGLEEALSHLRPGDTLIVWKLDRLARSLRHLLEIVERLKTAKQHLHSITERIDSSTAGGRLIFSVFGAIAEFEKGLIAERTHAGLAAARARGRTGGRPPALDAQQTAHARRLLSDREADVSAVARSLGVHRSTLYRLMKEPPVVTTPADQGKGTGTSTGKPRKAASSLRKLASTATPPKTTHQPDKGKKPAKTTKNRKP